jgi:IS5 family transposase
MENRNGLLVDFRVGPATGTAERDIALERVDNDLPGQHRITLAGDKGYDTRDFVKACRECNVTPHVAQNTCDAARRSTSERRDILAIPSV